MSNTVGYILLGSSAVPGLIAWDLSRRGLEKVSSAAQKVKNSAKKVAEAATKSQEVIVAAGGVADAAALTQTNAQIAQTASEVEDAVGDVREALKGLTGVFAPARVFAALALLLVVASLFALDVLSASAGEPQTTTPTTTTP